ncbi:alpha/beta fold hydrolase [Paenibacillus eucommiae]|uniref:Pimeloyl-ACP methyl ester carboxylesterase n=1 Tax=Paenibacillus eucommiae TaxID=1355755 RepID=A0ABS4IX13_9BACL|nr:alpha/beta hydrolase [Paenibacillus eucommiae]MBP1991079.1 pimeloyl-ACP methyl ester carboxylesterase [Paenibacillus eucommiae]
MKRFKKEEGKQLIYQSYERLVAAWGESVEELDIETRYGRTHVIVAGRRECPPLLLFHGVGDNSALMWIYNIQELARHFWVIAVDTMGGPGKSEPNEQYMKNFEQSLWMDDILESLDINSKIHLAGVSNGSYLACHYTIKRPDRVNKIVSMAGGITLNMLRMLMIFMPEALFPSEKNTARLLKKLTAPGSDVFQKNRELMLHWNYLLKYFNNRSMMHHTYRKFTHEEIGILKEKALFLIGQYDQLSHYPKSIQNLEKHQIYYKIIENAGHGINHEQPEVINEEIVRFLQA